jgi:signal peptidase I
MISRSPLKQSSYYRTWILGLFLMIASVCSMSANSSQSATSPKFFRSQLHGVSMHPTIKSGEYIVYQSVSIEELKPGDIIVFIDRRSGEKICHRVDSIESGLIKAKGDNNRFRDRGMITSENLIGRVTHISGQSV